MSIATEAPSLQEIFGDDAAVPVTLEMTTVPTMKKTGNPYVGHVTKYTKLSGIAGPDYQQARRDAGEPDFVAGKPPWGEVISPCVLRHKGNDYLRVQVLKSESVWFLDGEEVDREMFAPFLSESKEEAVVYRTIAEKSISTLRVRDDFWRFFR